VIHYRYDNRYLASVLKQYPHYFKGVARVDPLDPASPERLSRLAGCGKNGLNPQMYS
jgi:predicted TIM-barrel fold metal-dependent hydrolase